MNEPLVPGAYTALLDILYIRPQMSTTVPSVGGFKSGEPFTVFEVYPAVNGIVWGRISSNTGGGQSRYVGLRVNNHPKAKLERAFAVDDVYASLASAIHELAAAIKILANSD